MTRNVVNSEKKPSFPAYKLGVFEKWYHKLEAVAHWPWVPAVLFLISITDWFFMFIPSDAFLAAALLGYPQRTLLFVSSVLTSKAVGTVVSHYFGLMVPLQKISAISVEYHFETLWEKSLAFFESWGTFSVGVGALTPFPVQFLVMLNAAADVNMIKQVIFVVGGYIVKYIMLIILLRSGWWLVTHQK